MFWGKRMFHFFPDTNTYEISYPDSLVSYLTKIKNTFKKVAVASYTQFTTL